MLQLRGRRAAAISVGLRGRPKAPQGLVEAGARFDGALVPGSVRVRVAGRRHLVLVLAAGGGAKGGAGGGRRLGERGGVDLADLGRGVVVARGLVAKRSDFHC